MLICVGLIHEALKFAPKELAARWEENVISSLNISLSLVKNQALKYISHNTVHVVT